MLSLCPACGRHVRVDDARCPFCEHAGPRPAPPRRRRIGGLTRAAIFVAGTTLAGACGPDESSVGDVYGSPPTDDPAPPVADDDDGPHPEPPAPVYGGPPVDDTPPPEPPPEPEDEDPSSMGDVYGAPPAED